MPDAKTQLHRAFELLGSKKGFEARSSQVQLANLLFDCIQSGSPGAFEAPTGLGKSLAALIPAIALAIEENKRVVIATHTNVLTEQYWKKDLPFALSLFEGQLPSHQLLIGRQRYVCMLEVGSAAPQLLSQLREHRGLGIESEFRSLTKMRQREFSELWKSISSPSVCAGRSCPLYEDCFYYRARRNAEKASIVIANHHVVVSDAILKRSTEGELSMLGNYDFLIIDEAHSFADSARSSLEFVLDETTVNQSVRLASRVEEAIRSIGQKGSWELAQARFRKDIEAVRGMLRGLIDRNLEGAILSASPAEILTHPEAERRKKDSPEQEVAMLADQYAVALNNFVKAAREILHPPEPSPAVQHAAAMTHNYMLYLQEAAFHALNLMSPEGVSVTHLTKTGVRQDVVDVAAPLEEMLWSKTPAACLSATLAVDQEFEYLKKQTGFVPTFAEILPSPFDLGTHAAIYLPKSGKIPDPTRARAEGTENEYFYAVADEISQIIKLLNGRTLVLFHSRREMDEVKRRLTLPDSLPVLTQGFGSHSALGDQFRKSPQTSLFGLRSFWTGFDAPGETLSCVVLVRIPFEVPVEPPQVVRQIWYAQQGSDGFKEYTVPQAKMVVRQGLGRLIRTDQDKGLMALLDPRVHTKRYGQEFLENLPQECRTFTDVADALGYLGLDFSADSGPKDSAGLSFD